VLPKISDDPDLDLTPVTSDLLSALLHLDAQWLVETVKMQSETPSISRDGLSTDVAGEAELYGRRGSLLNVAAAMTRQTLQGVGFTAAGLRADAEATAVAAHLVLGIFLGRRWMRHHLRPLCIKVC
jgi:hypothetical protein